MLGQVSLSNEIKELVIVPDQLVQLILLLYRVAKVNQGRAHRVSATLRGRSSREGTLMN